MGNLVRQLLGVGTTASVPAADGEKCVHGLSAVATCQACVDACPRDAWVLDDERLGLDVTACDSCALCVPACPQQAIELGRTGLLKSERRPVAFGACEVAIANSSRALACLHALGVRDLERLYRDGVRELIVARGDCRACPRGKISRFDDAVCGFAAMQASRNREPLAVRELAPEQWHELSQDASPAADETCVSRRGLLTGLVHGISEAGRMHEAREATAIGGSSCDLDEAVFAFVPRIDGDTCEACNACIRVCPHGALREIKEPEGELCYQMQPEECTGCNLCVDVCEARAVSVTPWGRIGGPVVQLLEARCRACGQVFQYCQEGKAEGLLCSVCRQKDHHRNLYQVLD